jgi:hypothetical protein
MIASPGALAIAKRPAHEAARLWDCVRGASGTDGESLLLHRNASIPQLPKVLAHYSHNRLPRFGATSKRNRKLDARVFCIIEFQNCFEVLITAKPWCGLATEARE